LATSSSRCFISTFGLNNLTILLTHPKAMGCNIWRLGQTILIWSSSKTQGSRNIHERTL
jgi:hypothetical protein